MPEVLDGILDISGFRIGKLDESFLRIVALDDREVPTDVFFLVVDQDRIIRPIDISEDHIRIPFFERGFLSEFF